MKPETAGAGVEAEREDDEARERALDPTRSILLQAPAGSGKTTVLTERYLRLLAEVDQPEEIVAITFTRKAAAEMRERVLRALRGELAGEAAHVARQRALAAAAREHAAALGWALESNPARLRIQTIDALNHWIASQLPIAARAGGQLRVADRPAQMHRLAARRTLADADDDPDLQRHVELLFDRLDNDFRSFEDLLAQMLEKRAHWLPRLLRGESVELAARVTESLQAIVSSRLQSAAAILGESMVADGADLAAFAARGALDARTRALPLWQGIAALALTSTGELRRSLSKREGFGPEARAEKDRALAWLEALARIPGAREALAGIAALPPAVLSSDEAESLQALAAILTFAAQQLEVVFQELGQVDYAYVAAAARRALTEEGEPTDLALRLGARLRHVLVDEFQDTSIEQLELLGALTADWLPGDGRTVFAVGDPMQSIYLFREAEVGLFLRARERGLGALRFESLRLTRNFRSAGALIEWANGRFPRVFPAGDDVRTSAVSFLPCQPGRVHARAASIELCCTSGDDPQGEAAAIGALVARLRAAEPDASIAILVSSRSHAAPITAALEHAGVAVAGVDLVPLGEVPVVRDLAALTRALDHLGDRTAWLSVLRAPWCGLTLAELHALVADAPDAIVWELLEEPARLERLSPAARRRLERTRGVLAAALADRDRTPLADWVESTWLRLGGPAACRRDAELEHAEAFFAALARRWQAIDWRGPAELGELLSELRAGHASAPREAVQIMTIHAAKGLEFDHVILPGLGRRLRPDREPLMRWIELPRLPSGVDLLIAPLPPPGSRERHPIGEYVKRLQRERLRNERARLLYVAVTRARFGLHLFGHLCPPRSAGQLPRPEAGTLLEMLWPAIGAEFPSAPSIPASPRPPSEEAPKLERLPLDWRMPSLGPPLRAEKLNVANYEPAMSTAARRSQLRSERAAWLYSNEHREAVDRFELTGLHGGELASVVVDRMVVDAEGVRWVVSVCDDSLPAQGEADRQLIAAIVDRERPRLERARALARHLDDRNVRAAVYFRALDRWQDIGDA
jgi:ATP-dependent exoDNAse (exonuclease V) beta subunit